jgi:hypothetical protein
MRAMPQPVLMASRSVCSVWLTQSGIPACAQAGAVGGAATVTAEAIRDAVRRPV